MTVLKTAIVGLALILANTLVRVADWNNAAMDVMKAVNVGGNWGAAHRDSTAMDRSGR